MKRSRGTGMAEILVTLAVFSGLVALVLGIQEMSRRSASKGDAESAAYREALVAIGHLEDELRGARVASVTRERVVFRAPLVEDGLPMLAASGDFVYPPLESTLAVDADNQLVVLHPGLPPRVLARLGPLGGINFQMVSDRLLRVYVRCHHRPARRDRTRFEQHEESRFDLTQEILLLNQPR